MAKMLGVALAIATLIGAFAARAAELKPFAREDMASDVVRLTEDFSKETAKIGARIKGRATPQLLRDAAAAVAASNFKDAAAWLGAAVAAQPKDEAGWLAFAAASSSPRSCLSVTIPSPAAPRLC